MPGLVVEFVHKSVVVVAVVVNFEQDLARLMPLRFAKKLGCCLRSLSVPLDIPEAALEVEVELEALVEWASPKLKLWYIHFRKT